MEPTLVVPSLASTPRLLRNMTGDCSREQGWAQPKPGEWSIGEVVRHLVEGEYDAFLPRLKRMLAEERPIFDKRAGGPASTVRTWPHWSPSSSRCAARR